VGSGTLRTLQDPILLPPWVCFRGGGFPGSGHCAGLSSSALTAEPEPPRDPLRDSAGVCAQLGVSLRGYPISELGFTFNPLRPWVADTAPYGRKKLTATVSLDTHALSVFDSTAAVRTLGYVATVEARAGCDIVANRFSLDAVVARLRLDARAICDAVMDQEVGPR
jgi:hypothetical protein